MPAARRARPPGPSARDIVDTRRRSVRHLLRAAHARSRRGSHVRLLASTSVRSRAGSFKPPRFDPQQAYPLILEIHGGPFANYAPRSPTLCELYAAAGYVVFYRLPVRQHRLRRGIRRPDSPQLSGQDYDDLMSGLVAACSTAAMSITTSVRHRGSGGGLLTTGSLAISEIASARRWRPSP